MFVTVILAMTTCCTRTMSLQLLCQECIQPKFPLASLAQLGLNRRVMHSLSSIPVQPGRPLWVLQATHLRPVIMLHGPHIPLTIPRPALGSSLGCSCLRPHIHLLALACFLPYDLSRSLNNGISARNPERMQGGEGRQPRRKLHRRSRRGECATLFHSSHPTATLWKCSDQLLDIASSGYKVILPPFADFDVVSV